MDSTAPVLTGRDEIRMWKNICVLEKGAVKRSEKSNRKIDALIKEIQSSKDDVNPKILGKMMHVADIYGRKDLDSIILGLLGKCKLSDCTLQLDAVKLLLSIGAYDNARTVLDRITIITDIPRWEYYRGEVDLNDGNRDAASEHFLRSNEFDNTVLDVYSELERLDPGKGWSVRRRIESLRKGTVIEQAPSGSVLDDIYNSYLLAKEGDTSAALESLKHLDGFELDDPDIMLAMARISADDGSYQRSAEYYEKIVSKGQFSVRLELADVYIRNGDLAKASDLLDFMDKICPADRRLMETRIRALVSAKDMEGLQRYTEQYLFNDYADIAAYTVCVEAMIELCMHTEASKLISSMMIMDQDLPEANLLFSKNEFKAGRYQQALPYAKKAVKRMPDDNECQLHMSLVCLSLNRMKEARKHTDAVLKRCPDDMAALIRKKDICKAEKKTNEEADLCEKILSINPRDADVLKDLAHVLDGQGKHDEALRRFGESLEIRRDTVLFIKIVTSLVEQERYDDAIDIISRYDDMYGDMAETWIIKGNCEYAIGRYYDASDSYKRSLEIDHNNSRVWHSKGMADEAAGVFDEAEIDYDKAVLMDLDNKDYWISKATIQEKKGEYSQAIDSFNRVISIHPDNVYALMRKAILLVRLGKITEALFFIELAYNISPRDIKIQAVQRDIYFHEGNDDKCRDTCNKILHMDKNDADSLVILARISMRNGLYGEAIKQLVDADKVRGSDPVILNLLRESYHSLGDFEAEMSTCKVLLNVDPNNKDVKLALADVYMKLGRVDAAKKILNELHDESPTDPELSLRKAKMAVDESVAMTVLLDTLAHDPENVDLLMEVANMEIADGDREGAFTYLDRAIEADPTSTAPYLKKTEVLLSMGEYQKVLELLSGAIHQFKEPDPIIWQTLGDAQSKVGDNSNALISYDSAVKLGLATSGVYCKRGTVQEALGMKDAALNSYSLAHITDPDDPAPVEHIIETYMSNGNSDLASKEVEKYLAAGMISGGLLYIRARVQAMKSDVPGMKQTLDMCISNDVSDEYTDKVRELISKAEPDSSYISTDDGPQVEDQVIEEQPVQTEDDRQRDIARYAFIILQISNDTGKAPDDSSVLAESGVPQELVNDVFVYLSDIKEYGEITTGNSEFRRMEELSYRAIIGIGKTDLETQPLIPLAAAYFKSGANCLDEAKRLVAYIHRTMTVDMTPEYFSDDISPAVKAIEQSSGDITVYKVMETYHMGVYSARTVKMLSVKGGSSVVDHI